MYDADSIDIFQVSGSGYKWERANGETGYAMVATQSSPPLLLLPMDFPDDIRQAFLNQFEMPIHQSPSVSYPFREPPSTY